MLGIGCCPLTAWPPVLVPITREQCQAGAFHTSPRARFPLPSSRMPGGDGGHMPTHGCPQLLRSGKPPAVTRGVGEMAQRSAACRGSPALVLGGQEGQSSLAPHRPASAFGNGCSGCCRWGEPPARGCFGARGHHQRCAAGLGPCSGVGTGQGGRGVPGASLTTLALASPSTEISH